MPDLTKITIKECEDYNRHYYNGDYRGSEATPFNLEAIQKFTLFKNITIYQK